MLLETFGVVLTTLNGQLKDLYFLGIRLLNNKTHKLILVS